MAKYGYSQNRLGETLSTEIRPLVALVGESLLMDTVEANLASDCELDVMRIQTDVANTGKYLKSLSPDLIIFDWDTPQADFALPFLREQIGIPLVGLDIQSNKAVVLSSQLNTIQTTEELCQVIHMQTRHKISANKPGIVLFDKEILKQYFQNRTTRVS